MGFEAGTKMNVPQAKNLKNRPGRESPQGLGRSAQQTPEGLTPRGGDNIQEEGPGKTMKSKSPLSTFLNKVGTHPEDRVSRQQSAQDTGS